MTGVASRSEFPPLGGGHGEVPVRKYGAIL